MSAPTATKRVWAIVARREFVERGRDRGFLISTAITLIVLVGVIVGTSVLGGETRYRLGAVDDARQVAERSVQAAQLLDVDVELVTASDDAAAVAAVRDGRLDAAVIGGAEIVVRSEPSAELVGIVQAVSQRMRTEEALRGTGLSDEQIRAALDQAPMEIRALEPVDDRRRENSAVAFVGVLALYGQLFAYGYWVAAGVVEEKSSRVVEVLLATVRPSQLLRGKILGIGVLGLLQLLLIGVVGLIAAQTVGSLDFPSGAIATIGIVLVWFVFGFFFYAGLFAVAGSIVPRQEDLQSTMTPLTLLIVGSFLIGLNAIGNPSSTLATVASLLPPSAPLVMPSRIVLGETSLLGALLSVAITVAATVALVPLATRIYSAAVLRPGRVRIRQALRASRG
ncbi:MAG TPA: ABC transporter permease [Actinomycetota bacterium]|nr:ABC transporter permease [Actinomycetota bacterium]